MATQTDKLFSVVGIAQGNGIYKVRFANDVNRVKALTRAGFTDIRLAVLPAAVTKREAVLAIQGMEDFQDSLSQQLFADFLAEDEPKVKAPKATKKAKPAQTAAVEPNKEPVADPEEEEADIDPMLVISEHDEYDAGDDNIDDIRSMLAGA